MKRKFISWIPVVIVVLAVIIFLSTYRSNPIVPKSLADLQLVQLVEGDEAKELINRLHGKGVTPKSNTIGFYEGKTGKATLYVSTYGRIDDATEAFRRMARLIEAGNPVFGHFRTVEVEDRPVAFCLGMGRAHYFFAAEADLYWLEVDIPIAFDTVRELVVHLHGEGTGKDPVSRSTTSRLMFEQQFSTFIHRI